MLVDNNNNNNNDDQAEWQWILKTLINLDGFSIDIYILPLISALQQGYKQTMKT